jgi:hypothetical protein
MFYQCTQSPETSHLSIVTFNCPNNTVYDEDAVQCRDKHDDDNCQTRSDNSQLRGILFGLDNEEQPLVRCMKLNEKFAYLNSNPFQFQIRTKRALCPSNGHFPLEEDDRCSSTFLKCNQTPSGKMEGRITRCPSGFVYWQKSRRCERSTKVPDCQQKYTRQRLGVPVEWNNLGRRRSLKL